MIKEGSGFPIFCIAYSDARYPALLREITDPPACLYVRGNVELLNSPTLSVIGSRKITIYGERVVKELVPSLSAHFTISSGMALGTDGAAHAATVGARGKTIAVLGSGVDDDSLYPTTHVPLAFEILHSGGCIISEFEPGTRARPENFPIRNRIIAGLARGLLIIEAAKESGTMITARCALDYNRDVFTVPGSIFSETSKGTNSLMLHGALPVTQSQDILDFYGIAATQQSTLLLDSDELPIYKALSKDPQPLDTLAHTTGLDTPALSRVLMRLELAGHIIRLPGACFARK